MTDISVIILVGREKIHMQRCMEKLASLAPQQVFVVESQEDDGGHQVALDTAIKLGWRVQEGDPSSVAHPQLSPTLSVVFHAWPGTQALQFNWALDHLPIRTEWVLRLDADEYLSPELIEEIKNKLETLLEEVTGVAFHLRRVFMGRVIRRGMPRIKMIRLFRYGKARCEQRLMDEHIELLEGRSVTFDGDFADDNLNDIGWWTAKHNGYALREAVDLLDLEFGLLEGNETTKNTESTENKVAVSSGSQQYGGRGTEDVVAVGSGSRQYGGRSTVGSGSQQSAVGSGGRQSAGGLEGQAAGKRRMKMRYARAPLFWRAFVYFCYRYFLRGGFLEGKEGFLWHFLQGWWYRTLVDARVWEIKRASGGDPQKMLALLRGKYGMKI